MMTLLITNVIIVVFMGFPLLVYGSNCGTLTCSNGQYCCETAFSIRYCSDTYSLYGDCTYIYTVIPSSTSLSLGTIVGISVGAVLFCAVVITVCVCCCIASNQNTTGRVVQSRTITTTGVQPGGPVIYTSQLQPGGYNHQQFTQPVYLPPNQLPPGKAPGFAAPPYPETVEQTKIPE